MMKKLNGRLVCGVFVNETFIVFVLASGCLKRKYKRTTDYGCLSIEGTYTFILGSPKITHKRREY